MGMQGAIHATPHQQHHCTAEQTHAPAVHGFLLVVFCAVVGGQDPQLLQLCAVLAGAAAYAGLTPIHAVHALLPACNMMCMLCSLRST